MQKRGKAMFFGYGAKNNASQSITCHNKPLLIPSYFLPVSFVKQSFKQTWYSVKIMCLARALVPFSFLLYKKQTNIEVDFISQSITCHDKLYYFLAPLFLFFCNQAVTFIQTWHSVKIISVQQEHYCCFHLSCIKKKKHTGWLHFRK